MAGSGLIAARRWAVAAAVAALAGTAVLAPARATDDFSQRDLTCLALNVYHEARNQPLEGQLAVAHVTLNRVDETNASASICEIVYRSRHFSWTNDAAKRDEAPREPAAWEAAQRVARMAVDDRDGDPVRGSTFFHLDSIRPDWVRSMMRVRQIGDHIFYAQPPEPRSLRRLVARRGGDERTEVIAD